MKNLISSLYKLVDKSPLRALSLLMALVLAGCMFWNPSRFAAHTSALSVWHGLLLMWAVCAGVIHGIGFKLKAIQWQAVFCPLLAMIVLAAGLAFFFF
ncbi:MULTISPECIES: cyd operon protein YbgE [Mangrovibacter]|uniref:Cyd operon protein YbgE n=1 Tax=Mangrovibacter plantisponsor TaxID=451513 RepID=A0A317PTE3_9ENTR|nr:MULTISPECIES: cyd operon protein YbgE [Mangrovibacter]KEA51907.1 cytochrome bd biosynthesis protein [Mangrovibacter sp. MFB070]PWW04933.1 cyd operon protein YbgE [Mangrovibacter plantisponsor]